MLAHSLRIAAIGAGATVIMDLWILALKQTLGVKPTNYALVARWLLQVARGRLPRVPAAALPAVRGERALGWAAHYGIGIAFAALLALIAGPGWLARPTPLPALAFGAASVVAPYFVLQPALGLGIAASKAPKPWVARLRSLANHLVFGAGLYASAAAIAYLPSTV